MALNQNAIHARLEVIADALGLNYSEIEVAIRDEVELVEFAQRYNQSLDWIVTGDVRSYIRSARHSSTSDR